MKFRWYGIIGILAAFIACIADVLLLYHPNGAYQNLDYLFFKDISQERLLLGHYLGVLFIPLELIGFWQVYQAIKSAGQKYVVPVMAATVYITVVGVTYHGMVSMAGIAQRLSANQLADVAFYQNLFSAFKSHFEPLGFLLFLVFLFISLGLFYIIYFRETLYPKWVAFFNPLFTYIFIVFIYFLLPTIGPAFMVAGFNFSILLLLSISTIVLWNHS